MGNEDPNATPPVANVDPATLATPPAKPAPNILVILFLTVNLTVSIPLPSI
ncbi:hypothetical protein FACS1894104_5820 [Actinomycetota bacterium]|nr:hypothetical protein FACS1894104_5820 [Actinomycetota bacterium]